MQREHDHGKWETGNLSYYSMLAVAFYFCTNAGKSKYIQSERWIANLEITGDGSVTLRSRACVMLSESLKHFGRRPHAMDPRLAPMGVHGLNPNRLVGRLRNTLCDDLTSRSKTRFY